MALISVKEVRKHNRVYNLMVDNDGKEWLHINRPEPHSQGKHDAILVPFDAVRELMDSHTLEG